MARGRGGDGGVGVVVVVLIGLAMLLPYLILAAAVGGALALLFAWVRSLSEASSLSDAPGRNAFALSEHEQAALRHARDRVKGAEAALAELRERGAHLSTRNDGRFNEVSKLGKELNPLIDAQRQALSVATDAADALAALPETRRERYCSVLGRFRATSWSVCVMLVLSNGLMVFLDADGVASVTAWFKTGAAQSAMSNATVGALVVSVLLGMIGGWLFQFAAAGAFTAGVRRRLDALPDASLAMVGAYVASLPPSFSETP